MYHKMVFFTRKAFIYLILFLISSALLYKILQFTTASERKLKDNGQSVNYNKIKTINRRGCYYKIRAQPLLLIKVIGKYNANVVKI